MVIMRKDFFRIMQILAKFICTEFYIEIREIIVLFL